MLPPCTGPHCSNPATGVWRITFKRVAPTLRLLCAECGFNKMRNRVRAFASKDDGKLVFFKDVTGVELVSSFRRENVDVCLPGAKWWALETGPNSLQPAREPGTAHQTTRPLQFSREAAPRTSPTTAHATTRPAPTGLVQRTDYSNMGWDE